MKAYYLLLLTVSAQKLAFRFACSPFIPGALFYAFSAQIIAIFRGFPFFSRTTSTRIQLKILDSPCHLSATDFLHRPYIDYCSNLEMGSKYLRKSDVQLKPKNISTTKNDKMVLQKAVESWMPGDCNDVSWFQQITKEKLEFTRIG